MNSDVFILCREILVFVVSVVLQVLEENLAHQVTKDQLAGEELWVILVSQERMEQRVPKEQLYGT